MIYLIETTYYNKETGEIVDLLKIGYTGDSNKQTRYTQYRLHNPLFEVIFEIPEATELEEKKLQYYFREHQYGDYGNEWFEYSDDIIDYFKNHTTKESLIDLPDIPGNKRIELSKFRGEVRKAVEYVLSVKVDQGDIQPSDALKQVDSLTDHVMDKRIRTTKSLWKYIKDTFDILPPDYSEFPEVIRGEVSDFLFQFDSFTWFTDKMRLLCESSLTDKAINIILSQVPIEYKNYYITLGPEKIRSLSYQKSKLKYEYSNLKNNQEVKDDFINELFDMFPLSSRVSYLEIKKLLSEFYSKIGYNKTPKATDLLDYFEVKKVKITTEDGKRVDGYELLKRKE